MNRIAMLAGIAVLIIGTGIVAALVFTGGSDQSTDSPGETAAETLSEAAPASPAPGVSGSATQVGLTRQQILPDGSAQTTPAELPVLPWQDDGLNDLELPAAESLTSIYEAAPAAALTLATLNWVTDPDLFLEERLALYYIGELAEANPTLARQVAALPWLRGEVADEAVFALDQVQALAREEPELAAELAGAGWADDGITPEEQLTFAVVRLVAEENPGLARDILRSPEVADGLSGEELAALTGSDEFFLDRLEQDYPAVADIVKGYAWLSGDSALNLGPGAAPAQRDGGIGLLASPLPATLRSANENQALMLLIAIIPDLDPDLAAQVAALPWLADGVTDDESTVLFTFWELSRHDHRLIELLMDQPWFRDDLTEEEFARVAVLVKVCGVMPAYEELITRGQVQSHTFLFPTGEVKLIVVSYEPLDANAPTVFRLVQTSIEALEEFMGPPFIEPRLIMYLDNSRSGTERGRGGGYRTRTHFAVTAADPESNWFRSVTYHEIAHYYANFGPVWLDEGGAQFLTAYSCQFAGQTCDGASGLAARYASLMPSGGRDSLAVRCDRHPTVLDFLAESARMGGDVSGLTRPCAYPVGERFLLGMYLQFDQEITRSALRDLWRLDRRPYLITEEDIYQAFIDNTPAARHEEFKEHYRRLHGGRLGYEEGEVPEWILADPEASALLALFRSTNGANWSKNFGWLTNLPLEEWEGVGSDADGNVTGLFLSGNHLTGPIPPELGNLASLEYLGLDGNQLTGPIPPELGDLASLEHLDLAANHLTGSIPPELGNLANLTELSLPLNQLTGSIPPELGNLASLDTLALHSNQLGGPIPPELGRLANLGTLALGQNQLTGEMPTELGGLASLWYLNLDENQLSGAIPAWLGRLSSLRGLTLSANRFTGEIPGELANLRSLERFSIAGNNLTGCYPAALTGLPFNDFQYQSLPVCGGEVMTFSGSVETDRAALVAFYHATGGDIWSANIDAYIQPSDSGWLSDRPLGEWYGVGTDVNGRVTSLNMGGFDVIGQIPPELGQLSALRHLGLEGLTGPIPPELGNLTNLRSLDLRSYLTGPIPPELGNLTNLEMLNLGGNQLTGPIPPELGSLTRLNVLGLHGNQLTGPVPSELGNLTNLTHLSIVWGNQLTGCLPAALSYVPTNDYEQHPLPFCGEGFVAAIFIGSVETDRAALMSLYNATGGPNWTGGANWGTEAALIEWEGVSVDRHGRVEGLHVGEFGLTGTMPPELGNLTSLWSLVLSKNQLTGPLPPELGSLPNLLTLILSENQLTGPIPPELGNLTKLTRLWLAGNQFTGCIPEGLANVENNDLHTIDLHVCGTTPTPVPVSESGHPGDRAALIAIYHATGGPNWDNNTNWLSNLPLDQWVGVRTDDDNRVITLFKGQLTGPIPPEIGNLAKLKYLSLGNNQNNGQLTGPIPPGLGNLTNLESLVLYGHQLTGPLPPELGNLTNLKDLALGNNLLTGPIPPELGNLTKLEHLSLAGDDYVDNQLTGPIPPELGNLTNLTTLWLHNNQLTGPIPPELGNLTNVKALALDNNLLTGPIPPELGNLPNVETLSLGGNQLTGEIPPELGNLPDSLRGLGLTANQLTGQIPPELANLPERSLAINKNQLTGCVPDGVGKVIINRYSYDFDLPDC